MEDPTVRDVCKHVTVRTNLPAERSDCTFHTPLGTTREWPTVQSFVHKMGQRVKALTDKVESVHLSLIIELFKLDDKFAKGKVGFFEAGDGN